ncbi:TonB-linked SusC/RagA family outer membrane protein [Filimonas zeae]|uniref:SusC/RagA family TonB-linked outer membrane protein n=1 Tax=Filimonas zeae TaxID=1737353 RepID=A0A917MVD4_9BACT|nr:TonB-dependent receptor [Filimonas zeae]MDR6338906.1 TonB-linked SusC/RagA family outer membrane protein [Filimonas zeae]GGH66033.1 SusC/RagA family TonB-linked outer membrane protein [Filimonas zeae]
MNYSLFPGLKARRVLLTAGVLSGLCLSNALHAQQPASNVLKTAVHVNARKQSLEAILTHLSASTKVKFAYNADDMKQQIITLREQKDITLEELLNKVLAQTALTYEIHANTVVIFPKEDGGAAAMPGNVHLASYVMQARKEVLKGRVADGNTPLQNATVYIKGTSQGTVTDAEGNFSLETEGQEVRLVISLVGYQTREILVKAGAFTAVQLERAKESLDSVVVVVGYGTQKRSKVTGAVAEAKLDAMGSRSFNNLSEVLQGKAPGVMVQNEGGDPTATPTISIRGLGGINGAAPLYVIDGSIYPGTPVLNPNEIESVSVLKDASAAIYGAQASGGVILVTTKKGHKGEMAVSLDAKYGTQAAWRKLQATNAKEFADVMNLAADVAGKPRLDAFNAEKYPDGQITRTNWVDEVFRSGTIQDYNLSMDGGSEKSKYFLGLGYRKNEGILLNTYNQRYTLRLNSEHQVKPWLKIGENFSYFTTNGNGANTTSGYTGAILAAIYYPTNVPVYNADGSFAGLPAQYAGAYGDVLNPVAYLKRLDASTPFTTVVLNPYAEVALVRGLSFRSNFAYTQSFTFGKEFQTRVPEIGRISTSNSLNQNAATGSHILAEQTLNYTKALGKHNLNATAGYMYKSDKDRSFGVVTTGFEDENPIYRYLQNGTVDPNNKPSSSYSREVLISYIGRVNYDYNGRYLLSALLRRDGTSLVATNKFRNYYSLSAGWVVTREGFMEGVTWLNNLKLRASHGVIGNLGSLGRSAVSPPLQQMQIYMGQNPTTQTGFTATQVANPVLGWSESKQTNFGADIAVLNNKLTITADYFIKETDKMLMQVTPFATSGADGKWVNGGNSRDKGIELGIGYNDKVGKDFTYGAGATITTVSNKLVSLPDGNTQISGFPSVRGTLNPVLIQVGSPLYSYNVIPYAGIFQTQEEINNYKNKDGQLIQPNAKPGDLKFIDASGDGKITNEDRRINGSAFPKFTYGFSFNAAYKGFDINIFAQGVQGNKIFNAMKYTSLNAAIGQNYNMLKDVLNAWSETNRGSNIPRISASDANGNFGNTSSWYLENGSYLRVKNVTVGYTLPAPLMRKWHVNSVRVYATANNLFTFTGYKGLDPEVGMNQYGVDLGRYPQSRTFMAGINVNF